MLDDRLTDKEKLEVLYILLENKAAYECMNLKWAHKNKTGVNKDHHEYAYFLDELKSRGLAEYAKGRGEFVTYRII